MVFVRSSCSYSCLADFCYFFTCFFFFSSRRRHTRLVSDWSSDVCSSDLSKGDHEGDQNHRATGNGPAHPRRGDPPDNDLPFDADVPQACGEGHHETNPGQRRSEERRVGKECRSRWTPEHEKKQKAIREAT